MYVVASSTPPSETNCPIYNLKLNHIRRLFPDIPGAFGPNYTDPNDKTVVRHHESCQMTES